MERSEIERIEEIYIGNAGTQEKMGTSMSGLSAFSQDGQKQRNTKMVRWEKEEDSVDMNVDTEWEKQGHRASLTFPPFQTKRNDIALRKAEGMKKREWI